MSHHAYGNSDRDLPIQVLLLGLRREGATLPKFVIEREIPGAGQLTDAELHEVAMRSVAALNELGKRIQWLHTYVTDDKVYCVYVAADESIIQEHARRAGIPANRISAVRRLLDATAAE